MIGIKGHRMKQTKKNNTTNLALSNILLCSALCMLCVGLVFLMASCTQVPTSNVSNTSGDTNNSELSLGVPKAIPTPVLVPNETAPVSTPIGDHGVPVSTYADVHGCGGAGDTVWCDAKRKCVPPSEHGSCITVATGINVNDSVLPPTTPLTTPIVSSNFSNEQVTATQNISQIINLSQASNPPLIGIVGNDSDSHGCKASAGYSWCAVLSQCIRPWETNCTVASGSPSMNVSAENQTAINATQKIAVNSTN